MKKAKTSKISLRLSPEQRKSIEEAAERMGLDMSAYLRVAHRVVYDMVPKVFRTAARSSERGGETSAHEGAEGGAEGHS